MAAGSQPRIPAECVREDVGSCEEGWKEAMEAIGNARRAHRDPVLLRKVLTCISAEIPYDQE
jgi:hypothetical protein